MSPARVGSRLIAVLLVAAVSWLLSFAAVRWSSTLSWQTPTRADGVDRQRYEVVAEIDVSISKALLSNGFGEGDDDSALIIVEFSDYHCQFCGQHAREVYPSIKQDYIDTGLARYVFFNLPIRALSITDLTSPARYRAAEAATCAAAQDQFAQMHHWLFANPSLLASLETLEPVRWSIPFSGDINEFHRCLSQEADALVEAHLDVARSLNVRGVPLFLLGYIERDGEARLVREIEGAAAFGVFRRALGELDQLVTATAATAPGFGNLD